MNEASDLQSLFESRADRGDFLGAGKVEDGWGLCLSGGGAHEGADIKHMMFTPSGDKLITFATDERVRVFDVAAGSPPTILRGHVGWVVSGDITANGGSVVSASFDGTARIWRVDGSGKEIILDHGRNVAVYTARVNAANDTVAVATRNGAWVWPFRLTHLQKSVSGMTRMCLAVDQRVAALGESEAIAAKHHAACRARAAAR